MMGLRQNYGRDQRGDCLRRRAIPAFLRAGLVDPTKFYHQRANTVHLQDAVTFALDVVPHLGRRGTMAGGTSFIAASSHFEPMPSVGEPSTR